ncbi:MAG: hypothetical protein M1837_006639 [Sclerophora amabilis]|nr:MAG: hypothetical protein M1837_006639 [Sclerophora amabilis]
MAVDHTSPNATPVESTERSAAEVKNEEETEVTAGEWEAMETVLRNMYNFRSPDGHDPSKMFHRKVNKRVVPDYYDVIKEPMALSTVKANIHTKSYKKFSDYVRDFALIPHNAQVYNKAEAQAYQDALTFRSVLESELKRLVDDSIITPEIAALPDLGEIPPQSPGGAEEGEEEEEDEDDDDDEEGDDSDDDGARRRRRRGPRSSAAITRREGGGKGDDGGKGNDTDLRKKRGRPPRVDTPMEARVKAVLKGLRKFKGSGGELKVSHFERLPDKGLMPEYFAEIKNPMAIDLIKRKQKRKKYQSVDHFMKDVDTMFENAKMYNRDDSQIYKDAIDLQNEAHILAEQEKKRPDSDYVMEDGRLPLPNGILHIGQFWKVGDWVHIQNPNDVTKPIVAQIYRTWEDSEGQKWVNACWYYRPEQTVHRYERHFYENEVVKTGQYRDHHIDEVVDKCFVMFFTRFNKGRPRGFPLDKDVYVCESRYNEEKFKLNKIKTWASCLPDEVREKDYEMDLFDVPKKMRKVPSPIRHLLKEDAKETDGLPKPKWGVDNAPPIVGAVHKRPREANESPPPEPTPSPPPTAPPQTVRQASNLTNQAPNTGYPSNGQVDDAMGGHVPQRQMNGSAPAQPAHPPPNFNQQYPPQQYHQHSASPVPNFHQQAHTPQAPRSYTPNTSHTPFIPPQPPAHVTPQQQYSTPHQPISYSGPSGHQQNRGIAPTPVGGAAPAAAAAAAAAAAPAGGVGNAYNPPRPVEVYYLNDSANLSIPEDMREQFHRDEHGRILFFTSPPFYSSASASATSNSRPSGGTPGPLGHSIRYLAAKARRESLAEQEKKNKRANADEHDPSDTSEEAGRKRPKQTEKTDGERLYEEIGELKIRALGTLERQMAQGTEELLKGIYGGSGPRLREGLKWEEERLRASQAAEAEKIRAVRERGRERKENEKVKIRTGRVFADDLDAGY